MIVVMFSDQKIYNGIQTMLQDIGRSDICAFLPSLESQVCGLPDGTPIIVEGHPTTSARSGSDGLSLLHRLRVQTDKPTTDPLILLSYRSLKDLRRQAGTDVLETKGVAILQAPFLAAELKMILDQTPALSEAEWKEINCHLRQSDLQGQAAQLRHRSDSVFSTVLTALYELEKLSHFKAPEREHIRQNLEVVTTGLAGARLNEFEKQVNALAEEAGALGYLDRADRETVSTTFERLRGYAMLVEQALTADTGNWDCRCREAASIRQALKDVLDLLTKVGKSCGK